MEQRKGRKILKDLLMGCWMGYHLDLHLVCWMDWHWVHESQWGYQMVLLMGRKTLKDFHLEMM